MNQEKKDVLIDRCVAGFQLLLCMIAMIAAVELELRSRKKAGRKQQKEQQKHELKIKKMEHKQERKLYKMKLQQQNRKKHIGRK